MTVAEYKEIRVKFGDMELTNRWHRPKVCVSIPWQIPNESLGSLMMRFKRRPEWLAYLRCDLGITWFDRKQEKRAWSVSRALRRKNRGNHMRWMREGRWVNARL